MLEEHHSTPAASLQRGDELTFISPCGTHWIVQEVPDRSTASGRALIFASDGCWRRVRHYPAHWRELDVLALWELSWAR